MTAQQTQKAPGYQPAALAAGGGDADAAIGVSQLSEYLAETLQQDAALQDLWVRGEVAQATLADSGHLYFTLKDGGACLGCVMWRAYASLLPLLPAAGMALVAHGRLTLYPARGLYQLDVDDFEPDGAGEDEQDLERVRAGLAAEGLFDPARRRPVPVFPQRVAVVTSTAGAAVHDVCVTLRRGPHPPSVVLVPAVVQGAGGPASLCEGIRLANEASGADLLIIARGGGPTEDLAAFNDERVARAIAGSRLPVISAVGHETDVTLADLAAGLRVPTPTAAAELVVARRAEVIGRLDRASARATWVFSARLQAARLACAGLQRRAALVRPQRLLESRRARLAGLEGRLARSPELALGGPRRRLAGLLGRLEGVNPLATLARGFGAVTRLPDGARVMRAAQVAPGDVVRVRMAEGAFDARVEAVEVEARP